MKLKKEYTNIAFSVLMGFCMSLFMSFVMTLMNVGFNRLFLMIWMKSWSIAFISALPAALIFPTFIRKFLLLITED